MPTYEYNCPKCGHLEIWQSIKENSLAVCPTCGAKVERLISANIGFVLKGSGFYQNDYKKTKPSKSKKKVESNTEAKPEEKPVSKPAGSSEPACGACGDGKVCPMENN